jgi:hypothetical protein
MSYSIKPILTSLDLDTINPNTFYVQRQHNGDAVIKFNVCTNSNDLISSPLSWSVTWDYLSGSNATTYSNGTITTFNIPPITKQKMMLVTASGTITINGTITNIQLLLLVTIKPPTSLCDVKIGQIKNDGRDLNGRDLNINGQLIPPNIDENVPIIQNILNCHESKFTMTMNNFALGTIFPIEMTINNRSFGLFYRYTLYTSADFQVPGMFGAGNYLIQLTELNGLCTPSQTYEFIVVAPNVISVSAMFPKVACNGGNSSGSFVVQMDQITSLCTDYKIYLKVVNLDTDSPVDPETGNDIQYTGSNTGWFPINSGTSLEGNLSAGNYSVTAIQVCDGNCDFDSICGVNTEFTICQPDPINILLCDHDIKLKCNCDKTGRVTAWAFGGNAPYTYGLNETGSDQPVVYGSNPTFTGLGSGNYDLFVKDSNMCIAQCDFKITEPDLITITIRRKDNKCGVATMLSAHVIGGVPYGGCLDTTICMCNNNTDINPLFCPDPVLNAYLYKWYKSDNPTVVISTDSFIDHTNNVLTSGVYWVVVTDSNCCTKKSDNITVTSVVSNPIVTICKKWIDSCTYNLDVNIECGIGPFKYYIDDVLLDDDIKCYVFTKTNQFRLKVVGSDYKSTTVIF